MRLRAPARLGDRAARVAPRDATRCPRGKVLAVRSVTTRPTVAVLLPGSGSDHVFVRSVFEEPLAALGIRLHAPPPCLGPDVVDGMWTALDAAAAAASPDAAGTGASGPAGTTRPLVDGISLGQDAAGTRLSAADRAGAPRLLVGGISLGAHVAARWAARNPGRCAGLLLAMPAWLGSPGSSGGTTGAPTALTHTAVTPAAVAAATVTPTAVSHTAVAPAVVAAAASADAIVRDGLEATLAQVSAGAPPWVAGEVDRAWRAYGPALPAALRAAARADAPTADELRSCRLPAGIAAVADDPLHPAEVSRAWSVALPHSAVVTTTLTAVGHDRAALGRAALLAWLRAGRRHTTTSGPPARHGRPL